MICISVIGSSGLFLAEAMAADPVLFETQMLRLEFAEMKKHPDGQVSQRFIVHPPEDQAAPISVLFQENQNPDVYTVPLDNNTFIVFVDKPSCIRLFVYTGAGKSVHVVHTTIVLFGKSRSLARRTLAEPKAAAVLKTLPHIFLVSDETYYWHQTGIPLTFSLKAGFNIPDSAALHVLENNRIKSIAANDLHPMQFVYTPAHDDQLRQSGSTAVKQNILFSTLGHDGIQYHLAYALQLHRSRHAFDNQVAGTIALAGGFLLFAGLVIKKRRTPWWKE